MAGGSVTAFLAQQDSAGRVGNVSGDNPLPVAPQTSSGHALVAGEEYETIAASQTAQPLGATGAVGDVLVGLLIVPATTSPGAVSVTDGPGSAITVFAGGASSVVSLIPFFIPLGIRSLAGAWRVTTGANVSVVAVGEFT